MNEKSLIPHLRAMLFFTISFICSAPAHACLELTVAGKLELTPSGVPTVVLLPGTNRAMQYALEGARWNDVLKYRNLNVSFSAFTRSEKLSSHSLLQVRGAMKTASLSQIENQPVKILKSERCAP